MAVWDSEQNRKTIHLHSIDPSQAYAKDVEHVIV
jgi:hypothetical protein